MFTINNCAFCPLTRRTSRLPLLTIRISAFRLPTPTPRAAHPQGRAGGHKGAGRGAATAASERDRLYQAGSVALMPALPQLLGSFQTEPEVVRFLVYVHVCLFMLCFL